MERIEFELKIEGDIIEQMQVALDLVTHINQSLEAGKGEAYIFRTRQLEFLTGWEQIVVEIAKDTLPSLIALLIAYLKANSGKKIKIKIPGIDVELPSGRISDEQLDKLVAAILKALRERKAKK